MKEAQFVGQAIKWIRHKITLSNCSHWYKIPQRKAAVLNVQKLFSQFLIHQTKYSSGQMAILIKRHEGLLETILPIPNNPSYQNSLAMLNNLIAEAENIINKYNLEA